MVFTDNDLTDLKKDINKCDFDGNLHDLESLVARLEAAEVAMGTLAEVHSECDNGDCAEVLEDWRKVVGK